MTVKEELDKFLYELGKDKTTKEEGIKRVHEKLKEQASKDEQTILSTFKWLYNQGRKYGEEHPIKK